MQNAERSQLVMARILQKAMDMGIQEWMLTFDDLDLDAEFAQFFYPCLEWLEYEEIIRVKGYHRTIGGAANGSVQNVAITTLGQAVLSKQVDLIGDSEPLSETVKKFSSEPKSYSQFGDFLGGAIGGLIKSLGA